MSRLKKTFLILACLIAVGIYLNEIRVAFPIRSADQWEKPQPVKQSSLSEADLQELHENGEVDTVSYQLLRDALGNF